MLPIPLNLLKVIEDNKDALQPPVCNKMIYANEFKLMIIGGPNQRKDYHVNEGEEWFYQVKGGMVLKVPPRHPPLFSPLS